MRIVLRSFVNGLFLGRGSHWSSNPEDARAFLDVGRARDHKIYRGLTDTVVVALPDDVTAMAERLVQAAMNEAKWQWESKREKQGPMKMNIKQPIMKNNPIHKLGDFAAPKNVVSAVEAGKRGNKAKTSKVADPSIASETITEIEAKVDVGWGNALFIRGNGAGLTWEKGTPLTCFNGSSWVWLSPARDKVSFKLLLNDQIWAEGEDVIVEPGSKVELKPVFPLRAQ